MVIGIVCEFDPLHRGHALSLIHISEPTRH